MSFQSAPLSRICSAPPDSAKSEMHGPPDSAKSEMHGPPDSAKSEMHGPPDSAKSEMHGPPDSAKSEMHGPPDSAPTNPFHIILPLHPFRYQTARSFLASPNTSGVQEPYPSSRSRSKTKPFQPFTVRLRLTCRLRSAGNSGLGSVELHQWNGPFHTS